MRSKNNFLISMAILATSVIVFSLSARAASEKDDIANLEFLCSESNLIFIGQVTLVDYRMSTPHAKIDVSLPYTIVTYNINQILRGETPEELFTMRFIGGSNGRGQFLDVSGVPNFQVGEQDILFVSDNGQHGCPLVLCEWGRYRILDGRTYNAKGIPVLFIDGTRAIASGTPIQEFLNFSYPSPKFDDLLKNTEVQDIIEETGQSVDALRRRYEKEAPKQIQVVSVISDFDQQDYTEPDDPENIQETIPTHGITETPAMAISTFVSIVSNIVQNVNRIPDPLHSIDKDESFSIGMTLEPMMPPTAHTGGMLTQDSQTPEEVEEFERLRSQDFNPVIR